MGKHLKYIFLIREEIIGNMDLELEKYEIMAKQSHETATEFFELTKDLHATK